MPLKFLVYSSYLVVFTYSDTINDRCTLVDFVHLLSVLNAKLIWQSFCYFHKKGPAKIPKTYPIQVNTMASDLKYSSISDSYPMVKTVKFGHWVWLSRTSDADRIWNIRDILASSFDPVLCCYGPVSTYNLAIKLNLYCNQLRQKVLEHTQVKASSS